MNKQSNTYTIFYIIAMVVIVGAALAITATSLRGRQQANADADKMKQILHALHVPVDKGDVKSLYEEYVKQSMLVDAQGNVLEKVAGGKEAEAIFNTDVASQIALPDSQRRLPVWECKDYAGNAAYVIPVYGAGLWGPIWGYVAVAGDGSTISGAYFSHSSETPGLGAEIEKPAFQNEFNGKHLFVNGEFKPIAVVKAGQHPADSRDYVDGISGGTITSKGVGTMLDNCLKPYGAFLESIAKTSEHADSGHEDSSDNDELSAGEDSSDGEDSSGSEDSSDGEDS